MGDATRVKEAGGEFGWAKPPPWMAFAPLLLLWCCIGSGREEREAGKEEEMERRERGRRATRYQQWCHGVVAGPAAEDPGGAKEKLEAVVGNTEVKVEAEEAPDWVWTPPVGAASRARREPRKNPARETTSTGSSILAYADDAETMSSWTDYTALSRIDSSPVDELTSLTNDPVIISSPPLHRRTDGSPLSSITNKLVVI